jgi:hypothetical protein
MIYPVFQKIRTIYPAKIFKEPYAPVSNCNYLHCNYSKLLPLYLHNNSSLFFLARHLQGQLFTVHVYVVLEGTFECVL